LNKRNNDFPHKLKELLAAVSEKKAENLVILDVADLVGYTDHFVIATGKNAPHVRAMADAAAAALKIPNAKGINIESDSDATWILIDGGDFILHLFQPEARKYYALEDLWSDAKVLDFEK